MNYRKAFIVTCLSSLIALIVTSILLKKNNKLTFELATKLPSPKSITELELIDSTGKNMPSSELKGKWTVLTFGFTNCPDICPAAMASFKSEISLLKKSAKENVQFVFISVDPNRDSPKSLQNYADFFSKDIKTFTATEQNLKSLTKALGAHYEIEGDLSSPNYNVGHAPYYYIINPKFEWVAFYNPPILKGAISNEFNKVFN